VGLLTLAFGSLLDGSQLSVIFEGQRWVSGLKKKNEKVLGFWSLEDDPYG